MDLTCHPAPTFAPTSCDACGEPLVMTAVAGDEWAWVGADGSHVCPATAPPAWHSDPAAWEELRALTRAGDQAAGGFYSTLSCALTLGWHPYRRPHVVTGGESIGAVTPSCCGEPCWWRPSGWACRTRNHKS